MCFYVIGWFEYEWNQEYVLHNPKCPSEEEFFRDIREALSKVINELLATDNFIGMDDMVVKIIPLLEAKGYSRIKYEGVAKFWSTSEGIFRCMEEKDNIEILGEELCRKIQEHNDEVNKKLDEEIKSKFGDD